MSIASLSQRVVAPSPKDFAAYLRGTGWRLVQASASWTVFSHEHLGEVEVPLKSTAGDYARHAMFLIDDLARAETRTAAEVLRDVRSATLDIVRLRIDGARVEGGRLPIDLAPAADQAARDLLLAAACSAWDPRPVYAGRRPQEALDLIARSCFGAPEVGSYVMSFECPLPPPPLTLTGLDVGEPAEPFERRTTRRLMEGLAAATIAARDVEQGGDARQFRAHAAGISANLCDAVAQLLTVTAAESLVATVSFGALRPARGAAIAPIVVPKDLSVILREAAAALRNEAEYAAAEIVGPVVRLESPMAPGGGRVWVYAIFEGKGRNIAIDLDAPGYEQAITIHKEARQLAAVGTLVREGRQWTLRNACDVRGAIVAD